MARKYLTAPLPTTGLPPGVPYIVANEAAERFSFYGMRAILTQFMTHYLLSTSGALAVMTGDDATFYFHLFVGAVYFFPLLGAPLADIWLGKYRTILFLSLVYCLGHLALAVDETRYGLAIGLGLIALGSGGIKPCVSANVGDQFGESNRHHMAKVYGWFYWSINAGSFISTLLTPELLDRFGPHWAFGVPGLLMLLATIFFWAGRYKFVHAPPGGASTLREAVSREGLATLARLGSLYAFVAVFWALYDQHGSKWILQAEKMDRFIGGYEVLTSQVQVLNPILILVFIPLFSYVIYPACGRLFRVTPLRKIGAGMFLAALSFVVCAMVENWIEAGQKPHIGWQALAYIIMGAAEILVSVTILEFSYTQAPPKMKSLIMAINSFAVSIGNNLVSLVTWYFQDAEGNSTLAMSSWFWFWCGAMTLTGLAYIPFARLFREQSYVQHEAPPEPLAISANDAN